MEALAVIVGLFLSLIIFMAAGMWFLFDEIGQAVGILILVGLFIWMIVAVG